MARGLLGTLSLFTLSFANKLKINEKHSEEILQKSKEATANFIVMKSEGRYKKEYDVFTEWRRQNSYNPEKTDEDVMLAYLYDLSKKLWSKYSMVKSMLLVFENIDISKFPRLKQFLKWKSVDHQAKQAQTLSREEIYDCVEIPSIQISGNENCTINFKFALPKCS